MKKFIYGLIAIVAFGIVSCSKLNSQYEKEMYRAEKLMQSNPDSALSVLDAIDPSELTVDSLRAKYYFLKGSGHFSRDRSLIGDSLIVFAHQYYRDRDVVRGIRSGIVLA